MPDYIPGEIIDMIIAYLFPDAPTLCSCALVCRNWLPWSRFHLFRQIRFGTDLQYDLFVSRVLHVDNMRPWLQDTIRLVLHPSSKSNKPRKRLTIGLPLLSTLAWSMPALQEIQIFRMDCRFQSPSGSTLEAFRAYTGVRELVLWHCHLPSFGALREILVSMKALTTFRWTEVCWPDAGSQRELLMLSSQQLFPTVGLAKLVVDIATSTEGPNAAFQTFLRWLAVTDSPFTMRSIRVAQERVIAAYAELWEPIVEEVTDLSVTLEPNRDLRASLGCFPRLKNLHVNAIWYLSELWGRSVRFLGTLAPESRIRKLHLAFLIRPADLPPPWETPLAHDNTTDLSFLLGDLEVIDELLTDPRFEALNELFLDIALIKGSQPHLQNSWWLSNSGLKKLFSTKLPKFANRGSIQFRKRYRDLELSDEEYDYMVLE